MRLIESITIERNNMMAIVPAGTVIREVSEIDMIENRKFIAYIHNNYIKNIDVKEDKVIESEKEFEGARTDVDDWDIHIGVELTGHTDYTTTIPFTDELIRYYEDHFGDFAEDDLKEFFEIEFHDDLHNEIVEKFAIADLAEAPIDNIGESDGTEILALKIDGNTVEIAARSTFDRFIAEDEPLHRGRYRTGGYYPDA